MSSRMFQGVVLQMKDSVNRMVGVVDADGIVVACSELTCIGEHWSGAVAAVNSADHAAAHFEDKTFRPLAGWGAQFDYAAFVQGEDETAAALCSMAVVAFNGAKAYYEEKHDKATFVNTIVTYSINDDGDVVLGLPDEVSKYKTFNGTGYDETDKSGDVAEFVSSTSTYTVGGQRLVADNSTVFFFLDASGDYSVTVGLNKLSSRGVDVLADGKVSIVGYGEGTSRSAKAVFAVVEGTYASSANYALITDGRTKTSENGDTVYTYPVVFEDGQTGTLKTKLTDSIYKNTVYAYTLDSKGYVTEFDSADDYVINNVYVADRGNNTVTLNSAVEGEYDEFIDSKPLASSASVWNVEDTDDIFDTNLSKYDVVAVVLNDDYAIKTAFIVDTINEDDVADMTALEDLKVQFGGTDITKAIVGETITATFTKGGDQTVKYAVNGEDKGELSSGAAVYTVDGTESGKAVKAVSAVE